MRIVLRSIFSKLYAKAIEDDIFSSAAQVAFYFSFAIFPLLLFLVTLFGLLLGFGLGARLIGGSLQLQSDHSGTIVSCRVPQLTHSDHL